MAQAMRANKSLEGLLLIKNDLKDPSGEAFSESLRFNKTLQKLSLDLNFIGNKILL